jgi:hypothetical protein
MFAWKRWGVTDGFTHIRCGSNLGPADLEDDVAALEPVLGGKSVRVDLPKHCYGVRSSAARGRRRIGRGIWPDRNSVAAVGLGNGSFECAAEPHARSAWRAFFDAIIEGPNKWKVRPVFEIYSDSLVTQSQTFSGLVGAIWQVNDKLSFDAAVRYASVDGHPVSELRVGMIFGFPLILSKPMSAELPFAGARRR